MHYKKRAARLVLGGPVKQATDLSHPGLRARVLRRQRGKTISQVAEVANLSKAHLSRFERGEKALSVASLLRLASALEISVGTLIGEEIGTGEVHLVRANQEIGPVRPDDGGSYSFCSIGGPSIGTNHTTFLLELQEKYEHNSEAFHGGRELLYVLSGRVKIKVGKSEYTVSEGDYMEFPGTIPHVLKSTCGAAKVLLVVLGATQ